MKINVSFFSHRGKVREQNEDSLLVREVEGAFAVADGIGGEPGGEEASKLCCDALALSLGALKPLAERTHSRETVQRAETVLASAIVVANETVYKKTREYAKKKDRRSQMGTTVVAGLLSPGAFTVGWVGDSRCYLLRQGMLYPMTRDHTFIALHLERGGAPEDLDPETAHALLDAVGTDRTCTPEVKSFALQAGDVVLLCSDGVHGEIDPQTLGRALMESAPAAALQAAILAGRARDNLTGVVVKVEEV